MTLVDSSGWIEYFAEGPLADEYAQYLSRDDLLVPTVVVYEVHKFMLREVSEEAAMDVAARLQAHDVVPLTQHLALFAADLSLEHDLAMADAIVYATAQFHRAELITSDVVFADLSDVTYLAK
ncbi:MAG: type II toxin-antitoxin system VapC family toxin [Armatimonadota bacterium]